MIGENFLKLSLCSFAACLFQAASGQAIQPVFLNLPPPTPPAAPSSWASDVNRTGAVVGSYWADIRTSQDYLWQNGITTPFQGAGGSPAAINNNGVVALNNLSDVSVWANGVLTTLPGFHSLLPNYETAYNINDSSQVVGCQTRYIPVVIMGFPSQLPVAQIPLLWSGVSAPQQIAADVPGSFVCAQAVNNSGQVVVNSIKIGGPGKAYVWQHGRLSKNLGTLDATNGDTYAWAVNDAGQVVGYSARNYSNSNANDLHAFVWQNGVMQDLGLPPGAIHSWAFDIDSTGRILVGSENASYVRSYWVLKNGTFTQLAGLGADSFVSGNKAGSIAAVGLGAIAASVCPDVNGSSHACIWNLP